MSLGIRNIQNTYLDDCEKKNKISASGARQYEMLKQSETIPPIVDMRDAYSQVRKSNATISSSLISATTTKTYK
tara:strand:+ start:721 stop:942 length:222 start_codon:yes stop_codon:yes gene_type:complete